MRRLLRITAICIGVVVVVGFIAVRTQGPGTNAARRAARTLLQSQGIPDFVGVFVAAGRADAIHTLASMPDIMPSAAANVADRYVVPDIERNLGEATEVIVGIIAAHFSVYELRKLQTCWGLPRGRNLSEEEESIMKSCLVTTVARKWMANKQAIFVECQNAGVSYERHFLANDIAVYRNDPSSKGRPL